ncbi:unnamed protein product [Larinioides sclopetarius]|uniref:Uncharacterized protein n=1 Tax=Larinioides sclopetarius TaxID=280406 RepID=A0AAV2ATD3_9ARAC
MLVCNIMKLHGIMGSFEVNHISFLRLHFLQLTGNLPWISSSEHFGSTDM